MFEIPKLQVFELNDYKNLLHELKQRWEDVKNQPGVFRYQLNVEKEAVLEGELKFFVQVNMSCLNVYIEMKFLKKKKKCFFFKILS